MLTPLTLVNVKTKTLNYCINYDWLMGSHWQVMVLQICQQFPKRVSYNTANIPAWQINMCTCIALQCVFCKLRFLAGILGQRLFKQPFHKQASIYKYLQPAFPGRERGGTFSGGWSVPQLMETQSRR